MSKLTTVINVPRAPDIDTILQGWRSWCNQQPTLIKPLTGGLTNKSYLVESLGERYVVRVNAANSRALGLQRDMEARVLMSVSDTSIGSQLVYFDPCECYLVTRYIDGQHWQLSDSQSHEGINRLASLLKAIHGLEPVEYFLDVAIKADHYWQHIAGDSELAQSLRQLKPQVDHHIAQANKQNRHPVLCHNDLVVENLLLGNDQKLHALDWEYAAMGDPFFDLAVIVEEHKLNESESLQLLQSYLDGKPSKQDLNRLYSNQIIGCYLSVLWYTVKYAAGSERATHQDCKDRLICLQQLLSATL